MLVETQKVMVQCSKSENRCIGLQMARMEMDCTLKKLFITLCPRKLVKTQIMVNSLFENSLDILVKVFINIVCMKRHASLIWGQF